MYNYINSFFSNKQIRKDVLRIITGTVLVFVSMKNISTLSIKILLKENSHVKILLKIDDKPLEAILTSKEMDYHCIEKPYILFLVQY